MFTRLKSRDRDRDVISSRPRRDRYVRFFQTLETETRPRRSTFKTETRRDVPKKRLETASRPRRSRPRLQPWFSHHMSKAFCFAAVLFHWTSTLPDRGAAPQWIYQRLSPRSNAKYSFTALAYPASDFCRVKKSEIVPRFRLKSPLSRPRFETAHTTLRSVGEKRQP